MNRNYDRRDDLATSLYPGVELEDEIHAHASPLLVAPEGPSAESASSRQVFRVELEMDGEIDEDWLRALPL